MAVPAPAIPNPTTEKSPRARRWGPLSLRMFVVIMALLGTVSLWIVLDQLVLREFNMDRISAGMTQAEVEAILGPPNPLPDLKRNRQAFWDTHCHFGTRYCSILVQFAADGKVESTKFVRQGRNW